MEKYFDVVIVGGGPAGFAAALYCCRSGLTAAVFEKQSVGGQMSTTGQIDNYPGFSDGITGYELGVQMRSGAERFGAVVINEAVTEIVEDGKRINTESGSYTAGAVIIATGAYPRKLSVAGEEEFIGRGVTYCAQCDGMFYKGKTVVVAGGGNSAVSEALLLADICEKVYLVHRRNEITAEDRLTKQLEDSKVECLLNRVITEIVGADKVEGIIVKNKDSGKAEEISCSGVFVAVGRTPASEMLLDHGITDEKGYIVADESTETKIPGVFAAGDVRSKEVRQIVTAVSDGAVAAIKAYKYLRLKTEK